MDRSRYVALAARLETEAAAGPRRFRARALALAVAGAAYLFLVMLALTVAITWLMRLTLGTTMFQGWLPRAGVALGAILLILRQLPRRVRTAPHGRRLTRADAPALFEEVRRLRREIGAPRVHAIWLSGELNAGVAQEPRRFAPWMSRNHLVVGYPLLAALTPAEARAVVAHELAHLARAHSRLAGFVDGMRRTWSGIAAHLADPAAPIQLDPVGPLTRWLVPYLDVYGLVLLRRHEYEADALAARVVGAPTMAAALATLRVRERMVIEDHWEPLWRAADEGAPLPADAVTRLAGAACGPVDAARAARWLDEALRVPPEPASTHPSLAQRLAALVGGDGEVPGTAAVARALQAAARDRRLDTAAAALLADPAAMAAHFDAAWQEREADDWSQRAAEVAHSREALAALAALDETTPAGDAEGEGDDPQRLARLWARACHTREVHGTVAARPLAEEVLVRDPMHSGARFLLGAAMLEEGNARGVDHLERAMELDHRTVLPACELARDFLVRAGRGAEAERFVARSWAQQECYAEAHAERTAPPRAGAVYHPPALEAATVESLVAQLATRKQLRRAFLVRRAVRHFPDEPAHVLVLQSRLRWWWLAPQLIEDRVRAGLLDGLAVPAGVAVFAPPCEDVSLFGALGRVPRATVWQRA